MTNCHLVILKKPYLDAILEGRKRIESRITSPSYPNLKIHVTDSLSRGYI